MDFYIDRVKVADANILATFQVDMALESEGKSINYNVVLKGVTTALEDENKGLYFVVRNFQDFPIGSLLVTKEWSDWTNSWYWWIQSVYIEPKYRGKGLYSLLYNQVKCIAKDNGVHCLKLYVDHDNLNGQRIYEKLGMLRSHYVIYEAEL